MLALCCQRSTAFIIRVFLYALSLLARYEVHLTGRSCMCHSDPRPRMCRGRPRACLRRVLATRLAGYEYVSCELDQLSGRCLIYNNSLRALAAGTKVADT